eukprot:1158086-Pelagomonas_calceolata.AAC.9
MILVMMLAASMVLGLASGHTLSNNQSKAPSAYPIQATAGIPSPPWHAAHHSLGMKGRLSCEHVPNAHQYPMPPTQAHASQMTKA